MNDGLMICKYYDSFDNVAYIIKNSHGFKLSIWDLEDCYEYFVSYYETAENAAEKLKEFSCGTFYRVDF